MKVFNKKYVYIREKTILQLVGEHRNIIKVHEYLEDTNIQFFNNPQDNSLDKKSIIVMEYGKIDLFNLIKKVGAFSEPTARYIFKELLNGLLHCHSRGIGHSDIKPSNLMLTSAADFLLIDFGLA